MHELLFLDKYILFGTFETKINKFISQKEKYSENQLFKSCQLQVAQWVLDINATKTLPSWPFLSF